MVRLIILLIILAIGWCCFTGKININFDNWKNQTVETLKQEKTIKTINSSRDRTQSDVYKAIGEE